MDWSKFPASKNIQDRRSAKHRLYGNLATDPFEDDAEAVDGPETGEEYYNEPHPSGGVLGDLAGLRDIDDLTKKAKKK